LRARQRARVYENALVESRIARARIDCIDSHRCPCASIRPGRPEALYFYGVEGRGACLPVPGDKRLLAVAGGVLLVLSAGAADAAAHAQHASNADDAAGGAPGGDASCALSLFDLRARVLAHTAPLPDVAHALLARTQPLSAAPSPCRVTVLLSSSSASSSSASASDAAAPAPGGAFELRERDTPAKVEALLKRSLYPTALALLTAEGAPPAALGDVRRRFGDHLAAKRDYEGALAQWVATIGGGTPSNEANFGPNAPPSGSATAGVPSSGVPPSHVIRALLDARRPGDVARYLEALHAAGGAAAEHTTLLLHCYAAAKDAAKLDAFLSGTCTAQNAQHGLHQPQPVQLSPDAYRQRFDVPSVLRVLRAAGYPSAALGVAARAGDAAARLEILLEDMSAYDEALRLLEALPPSEAEAGFARYGRRLLAARPGATSAALLRSVGRAAAAPMAARGGGGGGGGPGAGLRRAAALAPLFAARPRALLRFLQRSIQACSGASASSSSSAVASSAAAAVADASPADAAAAAAVHNTLLELLLAQRLDADVAALAADAGAGAGADADADAAADADADDAEDDAAARAEAALRLLRDAWPAGREARYDAPHALVLCQSAAAAAASPSSSPSPSSAAASYARGVRFLLERLRLFPELLRSHAAAGDARGLLDAAQRLGARADASLWRDALSHLADATLAADAAHAASSGGPGASSGGGSGGGSGASSYGGEIREALEHIERARLLPPLAALTALARNPSLPLALARGFVARALAAEAAAAAADAAAAARLAGETARMRAELRELRTTPRVFQNSRCALCAQTLDAPAAHFLCMHSFHTRCLAENERYGFYSLFCDALSFLLLFALTHACTHARAQGVSEVRAGDAQHPRGEARAVRRRGRPGPLFPGAGEQRRRLRSRGGALRTRPAVRGSVCMCSSAHANCKLQMQMQRQRRKWTLPCVCACVRA
jgi:hypothetical protein